MLQSLRIKNIAIIQSLDLEFDKGLNVFTGETGAGKSIIIAAINLLLGKPFSDSLMLETQQSAYVEGVFDIDRTQLADEYQHYFNEDDTQIIVSRMLQRGKTSSTNRINDQTVSLKALKAVAPYLINIVGQHDHLQLRNDADQMRFLDSYQPTDITPHKDAYQTFFHDYQDCIKKRDAATESHSNQDRHIEFLEFQIKDIADQGFTENEDVELDDQRRALQHITKNKDLLYKLASNIKHLNDTIASIEQVKKKIGSEHEDSDKIEANISGLNTHSHELQELTESQLSDMQYLNTLDIDDIEQRLDTMFTFKTKYKVNSINALLDIKNALQEELNTITSKDKSLEELHAKIKKLDTVLKKSASTLHNTRKKVAKTLEGDLKKSLQDLMPDAVCSIELSYNEGAFNAHGSDSIQFLIAPNQGHSAQPLSKIASGGELSRIMLAIRDVFVDKTAAQTLIFDEIDTGVGGLTANRIGEKLAKITTKCQLLCITHLPQIAKMADAHILISKQVNDKLMTSTARVLNKNETADELKRMIGGQELLSLVENSTKISPIDE